MVRVMVLDHVLSEVIELEQILVNAGFDVVTLTGPYGILSKIDYEKPDILLFNPDMPNIDTDILLSSLTQSPSFANMVIVLVCTGDPESIEAYCQEEHVHGYYLTDRGLAGMPEYLKNFLA